MQLVFYSQFVKGFFINKIKVFTLYTHVFKVGCVLHSVLTEVQLMNPHLNIIHTPYFVYSIC